MLDVFGKLQPLSMKKALVSIDAVKGFKWFADRVPALVVANSYADTEVRDLLSLTQLCVSFCTGHFSLSLCFSLSLYLSVFVVILSFPLYFFRPRDIHWSRVNDTLPERAEVSGTTLVMSRLSQTHNGTYLCQAHNNYGRAADQYTLLVYGKRK